VPAQRPACPHMTLNCRVTEKLRRDAWGAQQLSIHGFQLLKEEVDMK
jgi:hypothetical protein